MDLDLFEFSYLTLQIWCWLCPLSWWRSVVTCLSDNTKVLIFKITIMLVYHTWCCSIDKLWSWRFSISFLSLRPFTSRQIVLLLSSIPIESSLSLPGLKRMMAFKQANSAGSMSSSLYMSSTVLRLVRPEARAGARSGNWEREKMVEECRGKHHWMEQSKKSSDQLSSSSRAWD